MQCAPLAIVREALFPVNKKTRELLFTHSWVVKWFRHPKEIEIFFKSERSYMHSNSSLILTLA